MPKRPQKEVIRCRHFRWLLGQRDGVWYADGRGNELDAGRHSLGTRDKTEALDRLSQLDLRQAVTLGLADPSTLADCAGEPLILDAGAKLYLAHVSRPEVAGGIRPSSRKRYKAVFDKFVPFAVGVGLRFWHQIGETTLHSYAAHLDDEGYAPRTEYLELTTIKQAVNWLIKQKRLPATCRLELTLKKPQGTDTYCWTVDQARAIICHCRSVPELGWLGSVVTALAMTGLRISELAGLRWSDIDLDGGMINLSDQGSGRRRPEARRTKSGRGRSFPIQDDLHHVLEGIERHPDGRVFHGPLGGKLKPDTVRNVFVREVLTPLEERFPTAEGDIGFRDGRLHSFRHFFCSLCAQRGVREQVVMHWLGHRDSKMVQHYFHLHDEDARRLIDRLSLFDSDTDDAVGV